MISVLMFCPNLYFKSGLMLFCALNIVAFNLKMRNEHFNGTQQLNAMKSLNQFIARIVKRRKVTENVEIRRQSNNHIRSFA